MRKIIREMDRTCKALLACCACLFLAASVLGILYLGRAADLREAQTGLDAQLAECSELSARRASLEEEVSRLEEETEGEEVYGIWTRELAELEDHLQG